MPTVRDVLAAIEAVAPARFAFADDRIGLQVGDPGATVTKLVVSLDPSLAAVKFARSHGAQMLVSHHPVIWEPLKDLRYDNYKGTVVRELIGGGVAFAAAHTNWDAAPGGINDVLAELLGLEDVKTIGSSSEKERCKVVVTAPVGSEDAVIDAMSSAGAGVIGLYERCAFSVKGTGTFRGLEGSDPAVGKSGQVENVEEVRIEMVCPADSVSGVIAALTAAHPYEEPACDVYPLKPVGGQRISRMGRLPRALSPQELQAWLDDKLSTKTLLCSPSDASINKVAVCGGAAAEEWKAACDAGADAFVTGEVPHHLMVEACESGLAIAACGHYATENPGALRLGDVIAERTGIQVLKFEPNDGESGRPSARR